MAGRNLLRLVGASPLGLSMLFCGLVVGLIQASTVPEGQTELDRTRAEAEAGQALAQFNLGEYYAKNAEHTNAVLWVPQSCGARFAQSASRLGCLLRQRSRSGKGPRRSRALVSIRQYAIGERERKRPPSAPGRSSLPPLPGGLVLRTNSPAANITNSSATSSQAGSRRVSRSQRTDALTAPESKLENITATVRPASPER